MRSPRSRPTARLPALLAAIALAGVAPACAPEAPAATPVDVRTLPAVSNEFRVTSMQARGENPPVGGNSREGFEAALREGIEFVEADFVLTKDGQLVAGHELFAGGTCDHYDKRTLAELRQCTLGGARHVGVLAELLRMPFREIYVDLKVAIDQPDRHVEGVKAAIADIKDAGREKTAILFLYDVTPEIDSLVKAAGLRAGTKGYPRTKEAAIAMIDLAARHGYEVTCFEVSWVDADIIAYAAERGVWLLPWDIREEWLIDHLRSITRAGIGGIITKNTRWARAKLSRHWQPDAFAKLRGDTTTRGG